MQHGVDLIVSKRRVNDALYRGDQHFVPLRSLDEVTQRSLSRLENKLIVETRPGEFPFLRVGVDIIA